MATKFAKNSPAKICWEWQFTSYLLPFLMNTNTSVMGLQRGQLAHGSYSNSGNYFSFLGNPPPPNYILIFPLPMQGVVHSSALVLCTPVQMKRGIFFPQWLETLGSHRPSLGGPLEGPREDVCAAEIKI